MTRFVVAGLFLASVVVCAVVTTSCICAGGGSCGGAGDPASVPLGGSDPPPAPAALTPPQLVTSECVLHAGGSKGHGDKDGGVHGTCWYNAECFTMPGHVAPGDGFVSMSCHEAACSCEWTSASDKRVLRASFTIDGVCDGDRMSAIFKEHCMAGLRVYVDDGGDDE